MKVTETMERCDEIQVVHCADGTKTLRYMDGGRCFLERRGLPDTTVDTDDASFGPAYLGFLVLVGGVIWWLWRIFA